MRIRKQGLFPKKSMISALGGNIVAAKAFSRDQAVFNEKAQQYARKGVITTPGYLRLETLLATSGAATSLNTIAFNTLDTSGTKIGFYLGAGAATAVGAPTAVEQAKEELHTFPNTQVVAIGANSGNLQALYNGYLSLRIDTTTFLDSIPMKQFYRVGDTQQGTVFATGGTATNKSTWETGMGKYPMLPTIELNGQSNIEFSITLPTSIPYTQVAATFINAVIVLEGFLNQGAASVQRNVQTVLRRQ